MPQSPDDYQPSEADLDLVLEEAAGKAVKPANLSSAIASLRQRITQLEAEKLRLLDTLASIAGEQDTAPNETLATLNRSIATACNRLADYEAQLDQKN